jgi:hypothetical protein
MNRFATLLLLAASAGLLVGCGDKPAPIIEAKPIDKPKADDTELKTPSRPEASDPDARKLLDDMLAAHTDGKPDKLAAFRECTFTRKGYQESTAGRFPAVWTRHLSWPGGYRLRVDLDLGGGVNQQILFAFGSSGAWRAVGGDKVKTPLGPDDRLDVTAQCHEDALALLFPFTDPAVVVSKAESKDPNVSEVHAWVPAVGYVRVGVDPKTKLLARLAYNGRESNVPVMKELTFGDHKEFAGVKLGTKVTVRTKAKPLGEWTDLTLDVLKPDPKLFDGP